MKKIIIYVIISALVLTGAVYKQKQKNAAAKASISSRLVGDWYCCKANSCNDMTIELHIKQQNDELSFERLMISDSGIGSSHLTGVAPVTNEYEAYAEYSYGTYFIAEEYMIEYFGRNNRWNIYTKDSNMTESIPGNYLHYTTWKQAD